jgi:glutamine synthetase
MVAPRIRTLFVDHLGLPRTRYLPGAPEAKPIRHCMTLFAQHFDNQMTVGAPGSKFLEGMPDVEAVWSADDLRPSWIDGERIAVCDLHFRGEPYPVGPRSVLRNAIARWTDDDLDPYVGIELEAFPIEQGDDGRWSPVKVPGSIVYQTGPIADPHGLIDDILEAAATAGLPVEAAHTEYDVPQLEFALEYGPALEHVDAIVVFKLMAQEIARAKGIHLTFLGKPFSDLGGSGLHVNLSMRDPSGANAFDGPGLDYGLSDTARWVIGGLLAHHEALSAIVAPNVNSYKRLRAGQMAGYWANWGLDHRFTSVRVSPDRGAATRLEYRQPDASANPYLATAAVLVAGWLGVQGRIEPPAIEQGDALETASTERSTPANLGDALDALEADTDFVEAFGPECVDNFLAIKRDEWAKYCAHTTDWEMSYYVPYL